MKKLFNAEQFTPTQHSNAEDKAKFANQFVRWVQSDFDPKPAYYPHWFYNRLSMAFGHIAHYNQGGFYQNWASSTLAKLDFLHHTAIWNSYGDPHYTYSDVEKVLALWVRDSGLVERYAALEANQIQLMEREQLARLKAKYETEAKQ